LANPTITNASQTRGQCDDQARDGLAPILLSPILRLRQRYRAPQLCSLFSSPALISSGGFSAVAGSGSSLPAPRFVSSPTFFTCSFVASAEGAPAGGVWGSDILGSSHWGRNICALPGLTVLLRPCTGQRSFVQLKGGWACCSGLCRADHLGDQAGVHGGHHDDNDHGRPGQLRGHHRSPAVKPERARSGAILAEAGRLPVPAGLYGVWVIRGLDGTVGWQWGVAASWARRPVAGWQCSFLLGGGAGGPRSRGGRSARRRPR